MIIAFIQVYNKQSKCNTYILQNQNACLFMMQETSTHTLQVDQTQNFLISLIIFKVITSYLF